MWISALCSFPFCMMGKRDEDSKRFRFFLPTFWFSYINTGMNTSVKKTLMRASSMSLNQQGRPLLLCPVTAGWPSPADDYIDETLNLHQYAVTNELATFFLYASGESMIGAGIFDGDLLVVDRSIEPLSGSVVIANLEGEMTVKRYVVKNKRYFLCPENRQYAPIEITGRDDVTLWGVVTYVLHKLSPQATLGSR